MLQFAKFLELLAIDHSSSKWRIIFVLWWLKFSHILVVVQIAWVRTFLQLSWIMRSRLAPSPGCQGSCDSPKRARQFGRFLRYTSGLEVLACSINTNLNYYALTAAFPEPLHKLVATFRGKMQQLFGHILKNRYIVPTALFPGHKALC